MISKAAVSRVAMATFLRDCQVRNITAVIILPLVGILLSIETEFTTKTKIWTLIFYFMSGIGITAGMIEQTIMSILLTVDRVSQTMVPSILRCEA